MFCPNCGTKVEKTDFFCEECGFNLKEYFKEELDENTYSSQEESCCDHEAAETSTNAPEKRVNKFAFTNIDLSSAASGISEAFATNQANESSKATLPSCIIFTNIKSLARSMKAEQKEIKELLESFIEEKSCIGLHYHLLDAGDYTYQRKGLWGGGKHVSLDAGNEVWDYMSVLEDFQEKITKETSRAPEYLFIIGGDDVIPMPCIKHYIKNDRHDDTIDTDLLYAYPHGSKVLHLFENMEIFKYDQQFFIGRLPFGSDASIEDLYDYLNRDIEHTLGVPLEEAYGQCDPNWKNVSVNVAGDIIGAGYMRNYDGRLADEHYFMRMILSPMVHRENVEQILNTEANLYYYNLHGGNAVQSRGYFGAVLGTNQTVPVIDPEHKSLCKNPNFVICEACYGARFIGLDKKHSMMLSAIHTNTMTFVGSSRVAWGAVDQKNSPNVGLCYADILAKYYIRALLEGMTAGQALYMARYSVLQSSQAGDPKAALSVTEFNLYGDPLMCMRVPREKVMSGKSVTPSTPFYDKEITLGSEVQEMKCNDNADTSLLSRVRNAVDNNIMQIHEKINKQLYANYGIEPRNIDSILKVRYANGHQELLFNYSLNDKDAEIPMYMSVTSSNDGNITNVTTSK